MNLKNIFKFNPKYPLYYGLKKNEVIRPSCIGGYLICIVIAFIWLLCSIISPTSAIIDINSTVTNTSIMWQWENTDINYIAIDGFHISNFDNNSKYLILNDLKPNSLHGILIKSDIDYGENITSTLSDNPIVLTKQEEFFSIVVFLIWFLLGLLCCLLGAVGKVPFIGWGGVVFGCIGITTGTNNSIIYFILYLVLILSGIFIGFIIDGD